VANATATAGVRDVSTPVDVQLRPGYLLVSTCAACAYETSARGFAAARAAVDDHMDARHHGRAEGSRTVAREVACG